MPQSPKAFWEEFGERMEFWELMFNRAPLYFLIQRATVFVYMVIFTIWYIHSRLW